nr:hypothetical protein [Tanacetum cinerariifolium]
EPEPEEEDNKEPLEDSDKTESFEEDENAALIDEFAVVSSSFPLPPTSPAYDQAPLGHKESMIHMRDDIPEEDMPTQRRFAFTAPPPGCDVANSSAARTPRGQYDFVDTIEVGQGLIRSPVHDARTIARAADKAEDVGYVRALQTSECRMMTSIEEFNLRRQSVRDLVVTQMMRIYALEVRAWTDKRTAYETKLHERQSIRDLVVTQMMRIYALEDDATKRSAGGLKRPVQPARVYSYTDFMKCQPLNFNWTKGVVGLSQWLKKVESVFHISGCAIDNQGTLKKKITDKYCPKGEIKKLEIELWNLKVQENDVASYTQRFQELALMCTKFLADETEKVDKYMSGLLDNIYRNVMSARPKTLDKTIELANDLMDQKLRTYAER